MSIPQCFGFQLTIDKGLRLSHNQWNSVNAIRYEDEKYLVLKNEKCQEWMIGKSLLHSIELQLFYQQMNNND